MTSCFHDYKYAKISKFLLTSIASPERMQNQEIFNKSKFILAKDKKDETLNDILLQKTIEDIIRCRCS